MAENVENNKIDIELKEDIAQGIYSNLAIITHSTSEFVIDFVRIMPGVPKAEVKSRIILTPEHCQTFVVCIKGKYCKIRICSGTNKKCRRNGRDCNSYEFWRFQLHRHDSA